MEACLARLDDDQWGAVVHRRDESVLAEARELERRGSTGPLAGVCFTVKAALHSGVLPATSGSLLLDGLPRRAAGAVQRLRDVGGLVVGVTNCAEFALAPLAENRRYGRTSNPVAPGRTPGGSSAGCAAAVAAGLVPLGIGTDYGGSVRFPAHCTGIYGFRPGRRTVPADGQVPTPPAKSPRARFSVPGLLAADVQSLEAAVPVLLARPVRPVAPRRIAWAVGHGQEAVDETVATAVERVARTLGAVPVDALGPNPLLRAGDAFDRIRATDDLEPVRTLAAGREYDLTDVMRDILDDGPLPPDPAAEAIAAELRAAARVFFRRCPVLIAPVATRVAPRADEPVPFSVLGPSRAVSLLGVPALAVPAGTDAEGVPVGVQLVGRVPELLWVAKVLADRSPRRR